MGKLQLPVLSGGQLRQGQDLDVKGVLSHENIAYGKEFRAVNPKIPSQKSPFVNLLDA
jgi:hypothetical protein